MHRYYAQVLAILPALFHAILDKLRTKLTMGLQKNAYEEEPFLERDERRQAAVGSSAVAGNARWLFPGLVHIAIFIAYTLAYVVALQRVNSNAGTALHGTIP
jgi:hypothetical protein